MERSIHHHTHPGGETNVGDMITFIIVSPTAVAMVAGFRSYAPDGENNSGENNNQHSHERRQHNNSPEIAATGRGGEDEGAVTPNDGRPFSFGHLLFNFDERLDL